jgi:hypothetical protein
VARSKKPTNGLLESFLILLASGHGDCNLLGAKSVATTALLNSWLFVEVDRISVGTRLYTKCARIERFQCIGVSF